VTIHTFIATEGLRVGVPGVDPGSDVVFAA